MSEAKTPIDRCRERNRVLRRKLFQWQEQAAEIGNLIGCSSVDIEEHIARIYAEVQRLTAEVEAAKRQIAEAEFVINGLHYLGTSTAAENAARSLNEYLEKYGTKKPCFRRRQGTR